METLSKKNVKANLMFLLLLIFVSCTKSNGTNGSNSNGTITSQSYTFGAPQFIVSQVTGLNFPQVSSIQNNITLTGESASRNDNTETIVEWFLTKNGQNSNISFIENVGSGLGYPKIAGYVVTADGNTIYAEINKILYKIDANSLGTYVNITTGFGNSNCIKVAASGGVTVTSDSLNGSLLQINDNGNIQVIASGLGNPGVFDIYNNEYYIVENTQTGTVVKITQNGTLTNILTDLDFPSNICFDNNGNFVLETLQTIQGINYRVFSLYTAGGIDITNLTDQNNNLIACEWPLSGAQQMITPLFIDGFNNLYFSTFTPSSVSLSGTSNPAFSINTDGLWFIQMTKK